MSGVEDEHSVEQFWAEATDPAFPDCICPGRADRGLDNLYLFAGEDSVDHPGERGVPVADQQRERRHTTIEVANENFVRWAAQELSLDPPKNVAC
jgi:hypothetical protein